MSGAISGLTTESGLQKLHQEIEKLVEEYDGVFNTRPWIRLLSYLRNNSSCYTVLSLISVVSMAILLLVAAGIADGERLSSGTTSWLAVEAIFLLFTAVFNLGVIYLQLTKLSSILTSLKKNVLAEIYECMNSRPSLSALCPDLHTPMSPCISLQWCLRDGCVVNMPKSLLVKDDVIVMRPGFHVPGLCQSLKDGKVLQADEIFLQDLASNEGSGPQPRTPLTNERFLLQETPILKNLRIMLENKFKRPLSFVENERIAICNEWMERRLLPIVLVAFLAINAVRYFQIDPEGSHWTEMLLLLQIQGVFPLVALVFPLMWISVNSYGQAHIYEVCQIYRSISSVPDSISSIGSCSDISVEDTRAATLFVDVLKKAAATMMSMDPSPCPRFEMLHTLASVTIGQIENYVLCPVTVYQNILVGARRVVVDTAFCCVDKKGILSWPNASAEKIFFFSSQDKRNSGREKEAGDGRIAKKEEENSAEGNSTREEDDRRTGKRGHHQPRKRSKSKLVRHQGSKIEVLDLTHESGKDAFGIEFDDPKWKDHLGALKPLGLASLLNTCNEDTSDWYTQFTDHVSCAARENEDTVAVVNRRCMCHLSREIGFTKEAVQVYNHEATFGVYRQVPVEESEKEKLNRARSFIQHKIPMPNQVSVLIKDKLSGMCQLLTQGTGDLVLDCCCDVWTGTDLQLLTEVDRKKVLDFYHRNSMIAYCTAFAYKPIPRVTSDWSSDMYTELMESPTTTKLSHGEDMGVFFDHEAGDISDRHHRSHSMDSLIDPSPTGSVEDLALGQMLQSHQTFIGMVSLQYQARQEFILLIDKLETACIRFVHFSNENEVRSRVFSEKLGLEAGWNCHVSLMSRQSVASTTSSCRNIPSLTNGDTTAGDNTKKGRVSEVQTSCLSVNSPTSVPRTHSAPSFVNVDEIQVKFATDPLPIVIDEEQGSLTALSDRDTDIDEDDRAEGEGETQRLIAEGNAGKEAEGVDVVGISDGRDREKQHLLSHKDKQGWSRRIDYSDSSSGDGDDDDSDDEDEDDEGDYDVQSTSHYTSSYITEFTEDSLTGALDNRAHLPRGIENIRPHLQSVDNVPLLVNLFTDCTPPSICEMVKIMQEYGEVVLILGSSLNMQNTQVFMQADCSLAIEPIFPKLCANKPEFSTLGQQDSSPIHVASRLLSLPCAFHFHSQENVKFIQLIMEARHYVFAMRNCFYLMLCCLLSTVLCQLISCLVLIPPPLSVQHIMWLVAIVIPTLSLSLMGNPNEARTMTMATHKNLPHVNKQIILEFIVQFCSRFIPSILVSITCYIIVLHSFCHSVSTPRCSVYHFSSSTNMTSPVRWTEKFQGGLVLAQNIFHFLFVFYLITISMSLVHWQDLLWQKLPFKNIAWSIISCAILVLQVIFCVADTYARQESFGLPLPLSLVHPSVWVLGSIWPVVTVVLNEFVKKRAIKLAVRRQKRARLDFDTKLGMNSPF